MPFEKINSRKGQATSVVVVFFLVLFLVLTLNLTKFPPQQLSYLLIAVVVFILAFIKTDFALGILIFSMLLSPELEIGQVADRAVVVRLDDILLFVIFLGWLAKLAVFKELGLLKRTPLNGPIFAYIFVCLLSTAVMLIGGQGSFKRSMFYLLKYFEYFLVYFLVVNNITDKKQIRRFVFLMVLTCFIVSGYGLYSYFSTGVRATAPFEGAHGEANTLAGYLVLMVSLMLGLFFYEESRRLKSVLLACLFLAVAALVFTLSRGGWVSFLFMFLFFILLTKRGRAQLIFIFLLMALSAPALAPRAVQQRISETFVGQKTYKVMGREIALDESSAARFETLGTGFKKMMQKPLLGQGIPGKSVVDNQYSRVMIETGLAGILAFFFLLSRIYKASSQTVARTKDDPFAQGMAVGFLAGFLGLLVHAFTAATFILIRIMEPFWFLAALVVALPGLVKQRASHEEFAGT